MEVENGPLEDHFPLYTNRWLSTSMLVPGRVYSEDGLGSYWQQDPPVSRGTRERSGGGSPGNSPKPACPLARWPACAKMACFSVCPQLMNMGEPLFAGSGCGGMPACSAGCPPESARGIQTVGHAWDCLGSHPGIEGLHFVDSELLWMSFNYFGAQGTSNAFWVVYKAALLKWSMRRTHSIFQIIGL